MKVVGKKASYHTTVGASLGSSCNFSGKNTVSGTWVVILITLGYFICIWMTCCMFLLEYYKSRSCCYIMCKNKKIAIPSPTLNLSQTLILTSIPDPTPNSKSNPNPKQKLKKKEHMSTHSLLSY